jgi:AraC-like DNA-binding protein
LTGLLFLLVPVSAAAFPHMPDSIRVTDWKMLYSQDDSPAAARAASGWAPIMISSKFRYPYPAKRDFQYAWLRGEFTISGDPGRYYGVTMGRIYFTYKIYINDYLIDEKTPPEIGNIHYPEGFIIPRTLLKSGKNQILLRLGIYGIEYGGLPDGVYIQPRAEYRRLKNFLDLLYNQLPIGILLLLVGGTILMLAVLIFYGFDNLFLYEILVMMLNSLYIVTIFSPFKLVPRDMIVPFLILAIPLFAYLLILIIQALYRVELHQYGRAILLAILLVSGVVGGVSYFQMNFYISPVYGLAVIMLCFPYAVYMTWRINKIRPDRFKFIAVMVLVNLLMAGGLLEVLFYLTGSRYSFLIVTYFSPFAILGFAVLGSREYQRRMINLKALYEQLQVSGQQKDHARKKIVTDSTEEKLKRIFEFIRENYTSDISREGLAAAVGMNPNYFSSQFKEYTGKKINDYINELRINDAIERLNNREEKIIDVALSTGFDSLSTFNRAFKNVTGMNPTDFRKM